MTPAELEDLQRMVALRMSMGFDEDNELLSWKERSERIRRRLAAVQMWTVDETRPTFKSALELAADAMVLLALVDAAEQMDHSSGEAL